MKYITNLTDNELVWSFNVGDEVISNEDLYYKYDSYQEQHFSKNQSYKVINCFPFADMPAVTVMNDIGYEVRLDGKYIRDNFEVPLPIINRYPIYVEHSDYLKYIDGDLTWGELLDRSPR